MNIPNDKLDLLQNLEFSVVTVWKIEVNVIPL